MTKIWSSSMKPELKKLFFLSLYYFVAVREAKSLNGYGKLAAICGKVASLRPQLAGH